MFLLSQLGPVRGVVVALAAALPSLGVAYEWYAVLYGDASEKVAYEPPDTEMIYAVQRDLLMAESRVPAGDPERTELFAVLGAGYAFEGVFAREVQAVSELLETEFGAEGRVVRLINDDGHPSAYPLLNRVNLRLALDRVGRRMNDDDILFLFLTSHGGQGVLSTTFYPVITRDIGPQDIDEALQAAGIRNAVIVISACYSGSFTDVLARPERLVLTAARGDRTSFGCNDKSDWTEWGRAFFVEALPLERDPRTAAVRAREIVAKREDAKGLEASEPQIQEGDAIGPVIERWLAELEADRD